MKIILVLPMVVHFYFYWTVTIKNFKRKYIIIIEET